MPSPLQFARPMRPVAASGALLLYCLVAPLHAAGGPPPVPRVNWDITVDVAHTEG